MYQLPLGYPIWISNCSPLGNVPKQTLDNNLDNFPIPEYRKIYLKETIRALPEYLSALSKKSPQVQAFVDTVYGYYLIASPFLKQLKKIGYSIGSFLYHAVIIDKIVRNTKRLYYGIRSFVESPKEYLHYLIEKIKSLSLSDIISYFGEGWRAYVRNIRENYRKLKEAFKELIEYIKEHLPPDLKLKIKNAIKGYIKRAKAHFKNYPSYVMNFIKKSYKKVKDKSIYLMPIWALATPLTLILATAYYFLLKPTLRPAKAFWKIISDQEYRKKILENYDRMMRENPNFRFTMATIAKLLGNIPDWALGIYLGLFVIPTVLSFAGPLSWVLGYMITLMGPIRFSTYILAASLAQIPSLGVRIYEKMISNKYLKHLALPFKYLGKASNRLYKLIYKLLKGKYPERDLDKDDIKVLSKMAIQSTISIYHILDKNILLLPEYMRKKIAKEEVGFDPVECLREYFNSLKTSYGELKKRVLQEIENEPSLRNMIREINRKVEERVWKKITEKYTYYQPPETTSMTFIESPSLISSSSVTT